MLRLSLRRIWQETLLASDSHNVREVGMRQEKPGRTELSSKILGENANYRPATVKRPIKMTNWEYAEMGSTYRSPMRNPQFVCR
jgi:hypothetical protein